MKPVFFPDHVSRTGRDCRQTDTIAPVDAIMIFQTRLPGKHLILNTLAIIMLCLACPAQSGPVNITVQESDQTDTGRDPRFSVSGNNPNSTELSREIIKTEDILKINATMRELIDKHVKSEEDIHARARALYSLMFSPDKFALQYDGSRTKTAIETIESGSGNCLSLANAFVAMARYAELDAFYLDVEVDENWQKEEDVYYQMKHTSAAVKTSRNQYLGIEFAWRGAASKAKSRVIRDERAFAAFYSNRGVEFLMQNDLETATANLEHAIAVDVTDTYSWSNLGIAYKRLKRYKAAEHAYRHALRNNRYDLTVLNNLSILYKETGNERLADKYETKLEQYRRKNPYYLIKLAEQAMDADDYKLALEYIDKAIRKDNEEHEFYFVAAKAYVHLGDAEKVLWNLEKAKQYSDKAISRERYSRKVEMLRELNFGHIDL
jgi:Tfp pilus assembly protein PilF